jgi:hypothetical protein
VAAVRGAQLGDGEADGGSGGGGGGGSVGGERDKSGDPKLPKWLTLGKK